MKREVILAGDSEVLAPGGSLDPGTAMYPWANTPSKKLYEVWNNLTPVPGVTSSHEGQYAYHWPVNSPTQIAQGFAIGPTLVRFTKMTITTGFDYSQSGPNNWWFPGDNDHGPRCEIIVRKRDLASWHIGTGTATHTMVYPDDDCNVNINTNPNIYKLYTLTWEMTAHPEGGPWLLEDINDLAVGVQFTTSNGPNGKAYEPSQGSFFKIRVPYLTVRLEVEDLGGYVENVRSTTSLALRMMRRARNVVTPKTLIHEMPSRIGQRVYMSHPRGPSVIEGEGWGRRRLERRAGMVLKRQYYPETFQVEAEAFDMRPYACLGWGCYRIQTPWNPELQGVALLDKGWGWQHTRNQDAWAPRPGDGVLNRVISDYPNVSYHGLVAQGGGDYSIAHYNFDLMQTGWTTVGTSGTFSASADATVSMVDEQGHLSSCRLAYGAGGGKGARQQVLGSLPYASGDRLHVRIVVKNTSVTTPATEFAEWYLARYNGGLEDQEWWDATNRVWTIVASYNPIPSSAPFGESICDSIPLDAPGASSNPTYAIGVGRLSASMGPVTIHGAVVDVQWSDGTVAGARSPLITLAATLTREPDAHVMPHVYARELWTHERGLAAIEIQPFWKADDLPDEAVKPLLFAYHATNTWDALQFVPKDGDDAIRFERAINGSSTYQLDCPVTGITLTRAHVLRAWARWLGPDGWSQYAPYSVEVGYGIFLASTGARVATGSVLGRLSVETPVPISREYLSIGHDPTRHLDGYVRSWETRLNPMHGIECVWKL